MVSTDLTNHRCSDCAQYAERGHNYCRQCGAHLTKGFVQNAPVREAFNASEKYCGYCGGRRDACGC